MPDPKNKLVKVDGLGVVHFPHYMSDDDIIKAIRGYDTADKDKHTHKTSPHATGVTTEQSEHARQTGDTPEVSPDWNTLRQAVAKATEPTVTPSKQGPLSPADTASDFATQSAEFFDNAVKRAGQVLFGVADLVPQTVTTLKDLFSDDENVSAQAETNLLNMHPGAQIADRLKEVKTDWKRDKKLAGSNITGDALGMWLIGRLVPHELPEWMKRAQKVKPEFLEPAPTMPKAGAPRLAAPEPTTLEGVIGGDTPRPTAPTRPASGLPAPPPTPEPVASYKLVFKIPEADQSTITDRLNKRQEALDNLQKIGVPPEQMPGTDPAAVSAWKKRNAAWFQQAEPWLTQLNDSQRDLHRFANRDVGHVRQLPTGEHVVYLDPAGIQSLYQAISGGNVKPGFGLSGVSLDRRTSSMVLDNLRIVKPEFGQEIAALIAAGRNPNGSVTISAVPMRGETMRDALGRLREELNHAWQKKFVDDMGEHLPAATFQNLHSQIPTNMQGYLAANGYRWDEADPLATRGRVLEASAKLLSEPPSRFGMTTADASKFLTKYFAEVEKQHGPKALDELLHTTVAAKLMKEGFINANRAAEGRTSEGVVGSVQAGRGAGGQGSSGSAGAAVPEPVPASPIANVTSLKEEAAQRAPEKTDLKQQAKRYAETQGHSLHETPYMPTDIRVQEIADAYEKLKHNPNDPAVKSSYDAMKADIDKQWNYATKDMGITFEPWKGNGQPYQNSTEMMDDVIDNHHLYFFQGGDMPADHPLAQVDQSGLTYNDKLRAVHDLFGHAVGKFQFGPRGEENAWIAHSQMFSKEALPALTTETKGQNSWVNFGPHMRNAQGGLLQQGDEGWTHPAQRPYAKQKAGLLPSRFHYRNDAPVSFISPNTLSLDLGQASSRRDSYIQKRFEGTARDLATALGVSPSVRTVLGSWEGGAENSVIHQFPVGTDPELVRYYNAILGKIGFQNSTGAFFPGEGDDHLYTFWTGDQDTSAVAKVLLDSGLENSTIEPAEGGHAVYLVGSGNDFREKVRDAANSLGVKGHVEEHSGTAEFPGNYTDRAAAGRDFSSTIEAFESRHPEWRSVREGFESRPDINSLHELIKSGGELGAEPQIDVVHYSNEPDIEALDPSYYGKNPKHDVTGSVVNRPDLRRKESFPQYWNPETYAGDESSPEFHRAAAERFGARKFTYKGKVGARGIYDFASDPDGILALSRKELEDQKFKQLGVRLQPSDAEVQAYAIKRLKDLGYSGRRDVNGLIASWEKIPVRKSSASPAEDLDRRMDLTDQVQMMLQRRDWTWKDIEKHVDDEMRARQNTPEKKQKLLDALNSYPVHEEWDAATKAGFSGRLWYDRSSRAFDALVESQPEIFKKADKTKFLNFVSALSPVQPVRQNLLMAINLWGKWVKADRPVDVVWKNTKKFQGVANKNAKLYRLLKGGKNTYGVDLNSRLFNAIRALQDQKLSGPKVSAFAPNLGKDVEKSTNDTWMAVFGDTDPNTINQPHNYDAMTVAVRMAARNNGLDTRQAQAAIWSFIKALAELSGWGKDRWIPPKEIIKQGLLTPELINKHASDFADMLANDDEIRERIEAIGGDLNALDRKLAKYVPARPDEAAIAHVDPRLLNAAERLEAARKNAKIQAHLAAKSDAAPSLFDTSFEPGISFSKTFAPEGEIMSPVQVDQRRKQEFLQEFARQKAEMLSQLQTEKKPAERATLMAALQRLEWMTNNLETHNMLSNVPLRKVESVEPKRLAKPIDVQMSLKREAEARRPERRRNFELRKRIDEMSPDEMRKLLLYDENTDLPNARSFYEAEHQGPASAVAMSDADGLKAFNDKFGYEAGNTLLKAKADALRQAGLEAYHDKGDEFMYRGTSVEDLKSKLEKAREILRNTMFDVTLDDGTQVKLKGVDFSYGTGTSLDEAERGQHAHKSEREARGERKRGELGGITEVQGQSPQDNSGKELIEQNREPVPVDVEMKLSKVEPFKPAEKAVLEKFMDDLYSKTKGNIFNARERILDDQSGVEAYPFSGTIHVSFIRSFEGNKGHGSKALKFLTDLADTHGVPMSLDPEPVKPMARRPGTWLNKRELTSWYKRNGFREDPNWGQMVRKPQGLHSITQQTDKGPMNSDKSVPVAQIEKLKAEANARDPRNPVMHSADVVKDVVKRSPSIVP